MSVFKKKAPDNGRAYCGFCKHFKYEKWMSDKCLHPKNAKDNWMEPGHELRFWPGTKNQCNDCEWYEAKK
jgi:hypothetical protein